MFQEITTAPYELKWLDEKERGQAKIISKKLREKGFSGNQEEFDAIALEHFAKIGQLYRRGDLYFLSKSIDLMLTNISSHYAKITAELLNVHGGDIKKGEIESRFEGLDNI